MTIQRHRILAWHKKWSAYLILDIYGDKTITSSKDAAWCTQNEDVATEMLKRCKETKTEFYDLETGKLDDVRWYIDTEMEEM